MLQHSLHQLVGHSTAQNHALWVWDICYWGCSCSVLLFKYVWNGAEKSYWFYCLFVCLSRRSLTVQPLLASAQSFLFLEIHFLLGRGSNGMSWHMPCGEQRTTHQIWFSPSTMDVPGMELGSLCSAESSLTCWAIL